MINTDVMFSIGDTHLFLHLFKLLNLKNTVCTVRITKRHSDVPFIHRYVLLFCYINAVFILYAWKWVVKSAVYSFVLINDLLVGDMLAVDLKLQVHTQPCATECTCLLLNHRGTSHCTGGMT